MTIAHISRLPLSRNVSHHKVWAQVIDGNEASMRVLEKVGFQQEGVLRDQEYADGEFVDVYRYGLLSSER